MALLLWEYAGNNLYAFALLDLDKDGKAEVVVPVHRQQFLVLNAVQAMEDTFWLDSFFAEHRRND